MTTRTARRYIVSRTNSTYYNTAWKTNQSAVFTQGGSATLCSIDSSIGQDDPLWRDKVVRAQDATHPFTRKGYKVNRPAYIRASSTTKSGSDLITSQGDGLFVDSYTQASEWSLPVDAALRDLALLRLKRKLSNHTNQQNLLVPIVELREMRGMIRSMAAYTTEFLYRLAGTAKTRGKSTKRAFDDAWLTYSFGLSPMVGDFKDALANVANHLNRGDHNVVLTGSAKKDWFSNYPPLISSLIFGSSARLDSHAYHELSYRYKAGFNLLLLSSNDYKWNDLFSFNVESLPSVGWELFPYSWVIDYFTNVGAFLNDTFVMPPGSTVYLLLNTRYRVSVDVNPALKTSAGTLAYADVLKPGRAEWDYLDRSKLTSLPRVGLHFKSVDQIGTNSLNKLLNLAALLKYR